MQFDAGTEPSAPQRRDRATGLWLASAPLLLYLACPIVALILFLRPSDWWRHLHDPTVGMALALTLRTTTLATAACVIFGLPVACLLARGTFRGRELLDTLTDLPLALPPVVAGVALLLAFGRQGLIGRYGETFGVRIPFTTLAVVMAQVFIAAPFFIKTARAGLEAVDPRLEEAARTLGAPPLRLFFTVTLPLARGSVVAGALLAWARALSEFGATMMFAGSLPGTTQTLPLAVMSAMETNLDTAVALSGVSLLLALTALILAKRLSRRWGVAGV